MDRNSRASLTGRPTRSSPKDDEATVRGHKRENEAARTLADNGYHVEQNPSPLPNGKKPDYKIDGKYFDCYSPSNSSPRNIASYIEREKVRKGQADGIVLNLDDSHVTLEALKKQLMDFPIAGLREIIAVRAGQVLPLFP